MAFQIGDTIGDYRIVGVLGKGGMGKVFRVRNLLSDRMEALKIVLPDLNADPSLADRFLREIRLHACLEHPNIATLRTALRVGNQVVMVMELVEGAGLDEHIRQGPMDINASVHYVDQVLSALELAHSRGIIHRDMKPANIIVTPEGQVKLTDFGIARAQGDAALTQSGTAMGSIYYMSPEQVQAQSADQRSDIYSLGVTFYEMVTGQRPIQGASEYAILNAHLLQVPAPPCSVNPSVPIALSAVIMKALNKLPIDRFQTATEFREALRVVQGYTSATRPAAEVTTIFDAAAFARSARTAHAGPTREQIESALVQSIGPIAKVLVAKTASQCSTMEELRDRLAGQLPDGAERKTFLNRLASGVNAQTPSAGVNSGEIAQWDPKVLTKAKQRLAVYAGPIASLIVDRAARKARTPQELYQALAAEISSERDRAAFLKQLP